MRVTTETQNQMALLNIQSTYARLSKLQTEISSGNQINTPSDNPAGLVQILQNNTQNAQLTSNLTTIQNASNVLQTSVTALTQAQSVLTSAVDTAQSAASIGADQSGSTSTYASQINADITQLLGLANTQLPDGTYIFGGTASNKPPFAITSTESNGQAGTISYQGNQQSSQVIVGSGLSVNTLIPGSSVFQPYISGTTQYSGATGAAAGSGTDTATGQGTLQVEHTQTTFDGSSGVQAGASSATGDTILGPDGANNLVIDDTSGTGAAGTVSLNGGPSVAFTNGDTDLKVTGPNGEIAYLDTTGITPGFDGTVSMTADGTLSTDGGATTTAIDFSSNQAITNSVTGATTNVNSSNIRQAGDDELTYPGQADLFQALIALRDTINNTQGLSAADRQATLNQQIGQLQQINTALATPLGNQSSQAQFLSNLQTRTTSLQTSLQQDTSTIQSANMASVIVQLQQEQTIYQAGLQIAAGLNQLSLSNFITT